MEYGLIPIEKEQNHRNYLLLFGTSYKTSPIGFRERFYSLLLENEKKGNLFSLFDCSEYSLIITCNRCEVLLVTDKPYNTIKLIDNFLEENGLPRSLFYFYWDKEVLRHMLSVSCGLDSESLLEEEIRYQLRKIGINSRIQGKSKGALPFIFDFCYNAAGRIRSKFNIESKSLASIVVKKICQLRKPRNVLLIGSGKTIASALKELQAEVLYVYTKRNGLPSYLAKAKKVMDYEIANVVSNCDLIISATISDSYIIRKEHINKRNIVILDFGFPRNVDPDISGYMDSILINIDEMARYLERNELKIGEITEEIEKEIETFYNTLYYSKLDQTIPSVYKWAEIIRGRELNKAISEIKSGKELNNVLDAFSKALISKILYPLTSFARESEENTRIIGRIFDDFLKDEN